jgi:hypothetical protein
MIVAFWGGQHPLTPTGPVSFRLYLGLLGHFQGVIHLNAEVTNRTLQLQGTRIKVSKGNDGCEHK